MGKKRTAKRIAYLALLTSASLLAFIFESFLPPIIVPGAKIGLGNVFILLTLFLFTPQEAYIVFFVRTILGVLICGNLSSLMYSLPAGVLSLAVEILFVKVVHPKISLIAISVVGATLHNLVQNVCFCLVMQNFGAITYLPVLLVVGVACGIVVGALTYLLIHKLPYSFWEKVVEITKKEGDNK